MPKQGLKQAKARIYSNPFGAFRAECRKALTGALHMVSSEISLPRFILTIPSSPIHGELSSSICFDLARRLGEQPSTIAERLVKQISLEDFSLVERVEAVGGYVNFHVNFPLLCKITHQAAENLKDEYGCLKIEPPQKIIVEHTSANPSGPLHAGTARNSLLGDALARLLKARGHSVKRHFYVDDVGKQVAMVAYAYKLLGEVPITKKPDVWIGQLYTMVNCILQINSLRKRLKETQTPAAEERLKRDLDEYAALAAELNEQHPDVFSRLLQATQSDVDPESRAEDIVRSYEAGEAATVRLIRRLVGKCLQGFRRTLRLAGVEFDSWDWESDLVWDGTVASAVEGLTKTDFVATEQGALALDVNRAADAFNLKQLLGYDAGYELSPLVLRRRDGTTLYTTRDIAYHIKKFKMAERVVNVIGVDQKLAQQQLKVALYLLGYSSVLDNLTHYAYEMVQLPGYKMSRRRGRYVTFDEIMDHAIAMAHSELDKRAPQMAEDMKRRISRVVGIGAVKYAMLSVSSTKTVTFTWDRVLNFETNSGPFIQYAHARACSVMRKAKRKPRQPDFTLMTHPLERKVMLMVARFPEVFREAADELKPELLLEFANSLADAFNAFYNELPILHAEKRCLRDARLCLVQDTRAVLHNSLELVGINAPTRM